MVPSPSHWVTSAVFPDGPTDALLCYNALPMLCALLLHCTWLLRHLASLSLAPNAPVHSNPLYCIPIQSVPVQAKAALRARSQLTRLRLTLTLTHLARRAFASLSSPPPGPIDSLSFPPPLAYPPGPNQTLPCLIDYAYLAILDPAFPCLALHHLTSPHLTSLGLQRSGAWCLVFGVPQGSFLLACDEIQNQDGLPAPLSLAAVPRRLFFSSLLFHLHSLDSSSSYRLLLDTHRRLLNLLPLAQLDFTRLDSTQLASPRRVDPYIPLLDGIGLNDYSTTLTHNPLTRSPFHPYSSTTLRQHSE
ncbi:hypothetical protein LY78DRAFT_673112 [Colletotrichum sublineola]|nr:hypothetical protein LY78DRAFT_673112 [Colletotrichum sublineola]